MTESNTAFADPYKAGPCPECGGFANRTEKHPGGPVFCSNHHRWYRDHAVPEIDSDDSPKLTDKEKLDKIVDFFGTAIVNTLDQIKTAEETVYSSFELDRAVEDHVRKERLLTLEVVRNRVIEIVNQ